MDCLHRSNTRLNRGQIRPIFVTNGLLTRNCKVTLSICDQVKGFLHHNQYYVINASKGNTRHLQLGGWSYFTYCMFVWLPYSVVNPAVHTGTNSPGLIFSFVSSLLSFTVLPASVGAGELAGWQLSTGRLYPPYYSQSNIVAYLYLSLPLC